MTKKLLGISLYGGLTLLLLATLAFGAVMYWDNPRRATPLVYSDSTMLNELWVQYKEDKLEPSSGRTLDKSQNAITTSEGQSYTMLRAVWMDDKQTFDQSWQFTKDNLQHKTDKLFAWKFGQRSDGSWGIVHDAGGNTAASDADTDIALSLLMAYSRWNDSSYLYQAREIINDIWNYEVVHVVGRPVLAANDLERNSPESIVVNPSYFAPYSYKLFAKVDPNHGWNALADSSYDILKSLSTDNLGSWRAVGLPPNWIKVHRHTGAFIPNADPSLSTDYGYDAMRIPFRMALDHHWNGDPRAREVLQNMWYLQERWWNEGQRLKAVYAHDGGTRGDYESPAMYGGAIGYYRVVDPGLADELYRQKLQTLYSPDTQKWRVPMGYYEDNWAWFGMALHQNALPNLAAINY